MSTVPYSAKENQYYQLIFNLADTDHDGKISVSEAAFFKKSGLPMKSLAVVWDLSNPERLLHLRSAEFFIALRLIAVAQCGVNPPTLQAVASQYSRPNPPLPTFGDIRYEILCNKTSSSVPGPVSMSVGQSGPSWTMTNEQFTKYAQQFQLADRDCDGFVLGKEVREQLLAAAGGGVAKDKLAQIWSLCDIGNTGKLDKYGYTAVLHLIRMVSAGQLCPPTLPASLQASALRACESTVKFDSGPHPASSTFSPNQSSSFPMGVASGFPTMSSFDDSAGRLFGTSAAAPNVYISANIFDTAPTVTKASNDSFPSLTSSKDSSFGFDGFSHPQSGGFAARGHGEDNFAPSGSAPHSNANVAVSTGGVASGDGGKKKAADFRNLFAAVTSDESTISSLVGGIDINAAVKPSKPTVTTTQSTAVPPTMPMANTAATIDSNNIGFSQQTGFSSQESFGFATSNFGSSNDCFDSFGPSDNVSGTNNQFKHATTSTFMTSIPSTSIRTKMFDTSGSSTTFGDFGAFGETNSSGNASIVAPQPISFATSTCPTGSMDSFGVSASPSSFTCNLGTFASPSESEKSTVPIPSVDHPIVSANFGFNDSSNGFGFDSFTSSITTNDLYASMPTKPVTKPTPTSSVFSPASDFDMFTSSSENVKTSITKPSVNPPSSSSNFSLNDSSAGFGFDSITSTTTTIDSYGMILANPVTKATPPSTLSSGAFNSFGVAGAFDVSGSFSGTAAIPPTVTLSNTVNVKKSLSPVLPSTINKPKAPPLVPAISLGFDMPTLSDNKISRNNNNSNSLGFSSNQLADSSPACDFSSGNDGQDFSSMTDVSFITTNRNIDSSTTDKNKLDLRKTDLENAVHVSLASVHSAKQQIASTKDVVTSLKGLINSLEQQKCNCDKQLLEQQQQLEDLKKVVSRMQSELLSLENDVFSKKSDIDVIGQSKREVEIEIASIELRLSLERNELILLSKKEDESKASLYKDLTKRSTIKKELDQIIAEKANFSALLSGSSDTEENLSLKLSEQLRQGQNELQKLKLEYEAKMSRQNAAASRNAQVQREINAVTSEIKQLRTNFADIRSDLNGHEQSRFEVSASMPSESTTFKTDNTDDDYDLDGGFDSFNGFDSFGPEGGIDTSGFQPVTSVKVERDTTSTVTEHSIGDSVVASQIPNRVDALPMFSLLGQRLLPTGINENNDVVGFSHDSFGSSTSATFESSWAAFDAEIVPTPVTEMSTDAVTNPSDGEFESFNNEMSGFGTGSFNSFQTQNDTRFPGTAINQPLREIDPAPPTTLGGISSSDFTAFDGESVSVTAFSYSDFAADTSGFETSEFGISNSEFYSDNNNKSVVTNQSDLNSTSEVGMGTSGDHEIFGEETLGNEDSFPNSDNLWAEFASLKDKNIDLT